MVTEGRRLRSVAGRALAGVRGSFMMDELEPRTLLAGSPFPDIGTLVDPDNTVVRFEVKIGTEVKDIDLELFDARGPRVGQDRAQPAPNTALNFLNYVESGRYAETIIHRRGETFVGLPFVLQGGGFKFRTAPHLTAIRTDAAIESEFRPLRSNIARTLAMALVDQGAGADPDSATSQWFINLQDNTSLDDQRFTVFGRVASDASWAVVNELAALPIQSFSDVDPDTNQLRPGGKAISAVMEETPIVGTPPAGTGLPSSRLAEDNLIYVVSAHVVKAKDSDAYYTERLVLPEGYRGANATETLDIVNADPNAESYYQVIVRYERGRRDTVISKGVLAAGEHKQIKLSDSSDVNVTTVGKWRPYSIEVRATKDVGAAISRTDFGSSTGEAFVNTDLLSSAEMRAWEFGGLSTTDASPTDPEIRNFSFLAFQNVSPFSTVVTVTFFLGDGTTVQATRRVEAYRRGGMEIHNIAGVTNDIAGIRVEATQDIVPAFSTFQRRTQAGTPPVVTNSAVLSAGLPGTGTVGILPSASFDATGDSYLTIVNSAASTAAVVTIQLQRNTGGLINVPTPVLVAAGRRQTFDVRAAATAAGIAANERFSILLRSTGSPVSAEYVSPIAGELVSTPVAFHGSFTQIFADGALDPALADASEILSIYNPYSNTDFTIRVSIAFAFAGATNNRIVLDVITLDNQARLDVDVRTLTQVVARINAETTKTYSIVVSAAGTDETNQSSFEAQIVAQLTRTRTSTRSAITSLATLGISDLALSDPSYLPPGGGS